MTAPLLPLVLALTGCIATPYGRMLPAQLRDIERARTDGSLACVDVLTRRSSINAFDASCSYANRTCRCTIETGTAFDHPLGYKAPVVEFRVHVCEQVWAEGVTFPGMDLETLAADYEREHR